MIFLFCFCCLLRAGIVGNTLLWSVCVIIRARGVSMNILPRHENNYVQKWFWHYYCVVSPNDGLCVSKWMADFSESPRKSGSQAAKEINAIVGNGNNNNQERRIMKSWEVISQPLRSTNAKRVSIFVRFFSFCSGDVLCTETKRIDGCAYGVCRTPYPRVRPTKLKKRRQNENYMFK